MTDMSKLRVLDLFSGIGGFSLGLERTGGFETVAFCEIEPFPRRVLAKHWPGVPCYEDVRTLTADALDRDGIGVDVITGGFPCQDLSVAGRRAGLNGERSGLWSEIVRLIRELSPSYVIVENVANLLSGPSEQRGGWFGRVLGDLAECGYDAEWENIPAAALGAQHRRERVWIVAYASQDRREISRGGDVGCVFDTARELWLWVESCGARSSRSAGALADADGLRHSRPRASRHAFSQAKGEDRETIKPIHGGLGDIWRTEPDVGRVADGVPQRVDRLAGLGNAVVPQIPELIGRAILASRRGVAA
ncbi:DNA cytosine methyltransferase [Tropicimonas sp. IMCC34011]|uniref:DNA cytosine methyltransferase n=1 Tax=Tropicimonas sp. IMCC34011 TaxID=2248759 RepID=UPI0018E4DE3C|nr:DNA cytosine methyltransferase [Tropicimonas sp. IMCC34011]